MRIIAKLPQEPPSKLFIEIVLKWWMQLSLDDHREVHRIFLKEMKFSIEPSFTYFINAHFYITQAYIHIQRKYNKMRK